MVTRTREQSSTLASSLRQLGADVLEVPTIRIVPPSSYAPLDAALARISEYDMLLVTSANTARVLAQRRPTPWGLPSEQPFTVAMGPATAEALREVGLRVDLQPMPSLAESVVRALAPGAQGKRMLLPRARFARDLMPDLLREAGASVEIVEAYQTVLAEESRAVLQAAFAEGAPRVDAVTFTSSSTVENFFALLGQKAARRALESSSACSIGPITSGTLREFGVEPAAAATEHDVGGLAAAVLRLLAQGHESSSV